ncbi:alkaline phosphatase family protein [uncultured Desulfobacter sp.]|uniref:alkaline phosphatase family protein n=1 Tax=uncultured Desulfobacter sp. TaxID=240139 RepID=UPI0029F5365A|nr:alkaline phosphatase family protein [uncultured Desulfobacter sp.]
MKRKALVIGLDGVPFGMLQQLMLEGIMPELAKIASGGHFGSMEVPLPPLSSVSWSSFMTGKGPASHGIFGFTDLGLNHELRLPSFLDLQSPTIFDLLGKKGLHSVVINMPATYPARPIPGMLVSGFVAPDLNRATYPAGLARDLADMGYRTDINMPECRKDHSRLFQELEQTLVCREKTANLLWDAAPWDLFVLIITGTDRLMHFCYDAWIDHHSHRHKDFLNYFRKVDAVIGRLYRRFTDSSKEDKALVLLSDHGFCELRLEVYLNRALSDVGLLNFRIPNPRLPSDIEPQTTQAFVLDPGRVHVNIKGRYNKGIVPEKQRSKVLEKVLKRLTALRYEGKPVVHSVVYKEKAFNGPMQELAPDAVLIPQRGVEFKGALNSKNIFSISQLKGTHTHDNAFWLTSIDAISWPPPQNIMELSQLLLQWLLKGEPV